MRNQEFGMRNEELGMRNWGWAGSLLMLCAWASVSYAQTELPFFLGDEVVVTASRVPQHITEVPVATTVIHRAELERWGARTLADVLRRLPGTDVRSFGFLGSTATARIRGSATDQVLVLRNGVRYRTVDTSIDMNDLLLTDVERIEVVRGPGSALYGADAVGGVINVITYGAQKDQLSFDAHYGTFNTQKYAASFGSVTDIGQMGLTFSHIQSDGHRTNSAYRAQNYQTSFQSLNFSLPVRGEIGFYSAEKGVPGSVAFPSPNNSQNDRVFNASAGTTLPFSDSAELSVDAQMSQTERAFTDVAFGANSNISTRLLGGTAQQTWDFGNSNGILGLEARNERVTSSNYVGIQSTITSGFYGQLIRPFWTGNVTTGLRLDSHSVYGSVLNPRVGVNLPAGKGNTVRIGYGTAYKSPVFDQLYWSSAFYVGNPNLRPERSQTFDIGWSQALGEESAFTTTWFTTQMTDRIANTPAVFNDDFSVVLAPGFPSNIAEASLRGLELEYERSVTEQATFTLNFTQQEAVDQTGAALPDTPGVKGNAMLDFDLGALSSTFMIRHVGTRFDSFAAANLPPFTTLDLRFGGSALGGATILIENLTNVQYQEVGGFPMPGTRGSILFRI